MSKNNGTKIFKQLLLRRYSYYQWYVIFSPIDKTFFECKYDGDDNPDESNDKTVFSQKVNLGRGSETFWNVSRTNDDRSLALSDMKDNLR